MSGAYYNEHDPFAAEWLRQLIKAGHIADGEVDERDIRDVVPNELARFTQCHLFAGIGGWSRALRLAGWPDSDPVWTVSCPCQPFSAAGKGKGFADERHLWPSAFHLISRITPTVLFGEQVTGKDGRAWLDLVQSDLEGEKYSVGALDLSAAGFGAPQIRQRLYFVADSDNKRCGEAWGTEGWSGISRSSALGYTESFGWLKRRPEPARITGRPSPVGTSHVNGFWKNAEWIYCTDKQWRPIEPGTFPLAPRSADRVGRLRGYGNSIVPDVAAGFIGAYMDEIQLRVIELQRSPEVTA